MKPSSVGLYEICKASGRNVRTSTPRVEEGFDCDAQHHRSLKCHSNAKSFIRLNVQDSEAWTWTLRLGHALRCPSPEVKLVAFLQTVFVTVWTIKFGVTFGHRKSATLSFKWLGLGTAHARDKKTGSHSVARAAAAAVEGHLRRQLLKMDAARVNCFDTLMNRWPSNTACCYVNPVFGPLTTVHELACVGRSPYNPDVSPKTWCWI